MILKLEVASPEKELEITTKFKLEVLDISDTFETIKSNIKHYLRVCKKGNILPAEFLVIKTKKIELE